MKFDSRKRKSWADERGVSEIVGNILILMITVTLFSSIIAFVQQMPVPEQVTKADFSGSIVFGPGGTSANLTLTHSGGAQIPREDVLVLVDVDSQSHVYYLANDSGFTSDIWSMGISWAKQVNNTAYTSEVKVTIVDLDKNNMIWTSQISGGSGNNPPVILERYVDSNPLTPTPDPVLEHDNFSLFVKVVDPDNDLDTSMIWIDSSQIQGVGATVRHWDVPHEESGVFEWLFNVWTPVEYSASDLDGAMIMIHARDQANHESASAYVMSVTILPVRPIIEEASEEPIGEGGLPWYLRYISGRQGFGVYPENKSGGIPRGVADVLNARTNFTKDEKVFVRVASLDMNNIMAENKVTMTDQRTGLVYIPTYVPISKPTEPFFSYTSGGNVFVYECKFNTEGLLPGLYTLGMKLSNLPSQSGGVSYPFKANQTIKIEQLGSPITFEPTVWLFKDSGRAQIWGQKTTPYEVSGGTYKIYGSVNVMDAQVTPAPTVEDIRVQDLSGSAQVYGRPVAGYMLPAWSASGNLTAYNFEIDLRYANGAQWMGGTNTYSLYLTKVSDSNEGVYSLSAQVFVKAYSSHADFFIGTTGIAIGHSNFDTKAYVLYVENNNFFTMNTLWSYTNTPSDNEIYATVAMGLGDLSGDGFEDLLVGQDNSQSLLYFKNSLETYGRWQDGSIITRPDAADGKNIRWIAFGDTNGDGATDFAYVSTGNKVVIFNNTYGMQGKVFLNYGTTVVRKIDLKDMNGDGKADLIALAGGKIYVHNLAVWGSGPTQMIRMPDTATAWSGGSGILDFDIADMNGDGKLDILTVGDAGTIASMPDFRGVWMNNYTTNAAPTAKFLDNTATYYNIRVAAGTKISGGDVQDTWAMSGSALQYAENMTTSPTGQVKVTMKFETLDSTDLVQTLVIRARLLEGTEEGFYAWYSMDSDGNGDKFVPMFQISSTAYVNYTFPLPSTVAGKAIYLRFTDATSSSGLFPDSIFIDYVAVLTHQYGGYTTQRTNVVVGSAAGWTCVRAGEIDNDIADMVGGVDIYPEVVAAKNGRWAAFQPRYNVGATPISGFDVTNANMYVYSTDTLMANTAPTLFDVTDINGDGYADILVTNYTAVQGDITQVGFYMNLYPAKVWYMIQEFGRDGGDGAVTVAIASNLSGS
jgi:FlaG/FlaF family flagellin (archaellin)